MLEDPEPLSSVEDLKPEDEVSSTLPPEILERREWIKNIRLKFCRRPEDPSTHTMIHDDGSINQDYFRPPKDLILPKERKWTEKERQLLIQGIEKHGIGSFRLISEELLPDWSATDLRIKTMRLMGRQNLQEYKGWKGTEEDMNVEFERNKEIGLACNAWKNNVLVADDEGKVLAMIKETAPQQGKRKREE